LFYVVNVSYMSLLFVDAFDELTYIITHFVSNRCLSYSDLYLLCKCHSIPNDYQDFANLLLWVVLIWTTL